VYATYSGGSFKNHPHKIIIIINNTEMNKEGEKIPTLDCIWHLVSFFKAILHGCLGQHCPPLHGCLGQHCPPLSITERLVDGGIH